MPNRSEIAAQVIGQEPVAQKLARAARPTRKQGRGLGLKDPDLLPNSVCGHALITSLVDTVLRFVALPVSAAIGIALWILHAHAHDAADVSPILILTSPEKRCGKTTVLSLLRFLVPRPLLASNISTAAVFRVVHEHGPTLLIDEADSFLRDNEDMRGVLNSGHSRAGAAVIRTVGDDFEVRQFRTWAPKAIAHIGRLASTLEDRAIVISLRRKALGEQVERLRLDRQQEFKPLCQQAWKWARDNEAALRAADPDIPPALHDRAADNWRPLLAIADRLGENWPALARDAALELSGATAESDTTPGIQLLADLRELFEPGTDRLATAEIIKALLEMEDRPWADWKGRDLTPVQMARLLKPFGVKPQMIRIGTATVRGYPLENFTDAFTRYLPAEVQHPQQGSRGVVSAMPPTRNSLEAVSPHHRVGEPRQSRPVVDVAAQNPPPSADPEPAAGDDATAPAADEPKVEREPRHGPAYTPAHDCPRGPAWEAIDVRGVRVCRACHTVLAGDLTSALEAASGSPVAGAGNGPMSAIPDCEGDDKDEPPAPNLAVADVALPGIQE